MLAKLYTVIVVLIGLSMMIGLQACVDEAYGPGWGAARQAHEVREFNYGPKHEVCDANGYNCMVCDQDNDYCRRLSSGYGNSYGW